MGKIHMVTSCPDCHGTGTRNYIDEDGNPVVETPCSLCDGFGNRAAWLGLDDTLIQDIYDKLKKVKKTVDDIWEKVNV